MTSEDSEIPASGQDAVEACYDEYLAAALRGEALDPEEFLRAWPEVPAVVRQRLNDIRRLAAPGAGELRPGARVAGYRLVEELGRGGMGVVWLATQEELGRAVALKLLRPELSTSPSAHERFRREARGLARVRHRHIVGVLDFGTAAGGLYLAMEFVAGRDLRSILAGQQRPDLGALVRWGAEVARALSCVHEAGILHRDIKPSNVRVDESGAAVLVDFGLVREIGDSLDSLTEGFTGSRPYASPEQLTGRALDARSDVYSLGVVLYEALAGRPPFTGRDQESLMEAILRGDPQPLRHLVRSLPRDLEIVVLKALERDPERRYASAAELADDLEAVLALRPIRARPPGWGGRARKWCRRNPWLAAGLGAAALALLAAIVAIAARSHLAQRERLAEAGALLAQGRELVDSIASSRAQQASLEFRVGLWQRSLHDSFLTEDQYAELDKSEDGVRAERRRREELTYQVLELLRRAEELDPGLEGADRVRAELYLQRMIEADGALDTIARDVYSDQVRRWDPSGELLRAARAPTVVEIHSDPPGAEVQAFRYREQSELFEGGEPRLVPVPVGDDPSAPRPGTWALRVTRAVGELRPGDAIVELAGWPIEGVLLVESEARAPGEWDRLAEIDGEPARCAWHLDQARAPRAGAAAAQPRRITIERPASRGGGRVELTLEELDAAGRRVLEARALAELGGVGARVWRDGEWIELELPRGLEVRASAAVPFATTAARLGTTPLSDIELVPGEYLFVFRRDGFESRRLSLRAGAGGSSRIDVRLAPEGGTPRGFVRVAAQWSERIPDFLIQEREVICAEYLEFLCDFDTLAEIDASNRTRYVPRGGERPEGYWPRSADGGFELPDDWRADWPVLGISFEDAQAYAAWLTRRARAEGRPWTLRLPTRAELVAASSGLRPAPFSYGYRFRPRWSKSCFAQRQASPEPVLRYPVDESPFGVYDVCGSAMEWIEDWYDRGRGLRWAMAGGWAQGNTDALRIEGGIGFLPDQTTGETGLRLVLVIDGEDP